MAKAKAVRAETSTEALLERIKTLENRLSTVEAGLEAEAALFAVSSSLQPQTNEKSQVNGHDQESNGHVGLGVLSDWSAPGGHPEEHDRVPGSNGLVDDVEPDDDDPEGVDPEAVSEAAARRKQPDSPVPFTPGDVRSRLGKPGGVMLTGAARLPRNVRAAWQRELAMVDLLDADWTAEAEPIAALAHPVRLALLREVLKGARSVSALASLPGLGTSGQLYHHLKPLLAEGWLQPAGRGRYEVPNDRVLPLLGIIAAVRRP